MLEYECPSCGGTLEFDTATQRLKCPYCDSEYDVEAFTAQLENKKADLGKETDAPLSHKDHEWVDPNLLIYVCQSCGGEIIGDKHMGATTCPYCNNNVVVTKQFEGVLKPDFIIPFKLDKATAMKKMADHFKGKKLLPKMFSQENKLQEIKGIYVPFWLYDMEADGTALFEGTKVRTWADKKYHYTETSYYDCFRNGKATFAKIPADASSKMADDLMDSIETYDYKDLVPFNAGYLAGFMADKYDLDEQSQLERAKNRAKATVKQELKNTVTGYSTVTEKDANISSTKQEYKYALLPVWVMSTKWKDQNFIFAMNGQTGKFVGNLLMDKSLYWKYFGIAGAIGAIITALIEIIIYII